MLQRTKSAISNRVRNAFRKEAATLTPQDVQDARQYIRAYWAKLQRYHPKDDETLIGLPKPYLVPSAPMAGHNFDFDEMYYWDSYFMVQGLLDGEHEELVEGMLENLCVIFKRLKVIPNASRIYFAGRSQPPFLTTLIFDLYERYNKDKKWLKKYITVAENEYQTVWMGEAKPHARLVYEGLSRYYDFNYLDDIAETESGWDMTPRFNRKALRHLPVDLNALLYKYETDFARAARLLGDKTAAKQWEMAAKKRARTLDRLMWSPAKKFYFDYNFVKKRRGTVYSLAGFFPMWAGMVSERRAAQ
ncbi:MAG TPA: trehalase family glycosidase, partial [Candidatus Saccharimonadales bacterium]|nr:trehalase family glycosidase [Candidatus Saccharimonadales bacterium]